MAKKSRIVGGYPHTPKMRTADALCRAEHDCSLREFMFSWRQNNPHRGVDELAEFFRVDRSTIYEWLKLLRIATGGVVFIDLDSQHAA